MADAKKDPLDRIAVGALGEWAKGKSLEDLEVDVTSGEPFFPDTITRIDYLERKLIETPVLFRLPTPLEQTESHVRALDYLAKVKGLPASDFTEILTFPRPPTSGSATSDATCPLKRNRSQPARASERSSQRS